MTKGVARKKCNCNKKKRVAIAAKTPKFRKIFT